ncbi:ankyrin repeat and sterile alpha motif domain-containing protein 1B-like [Salvelinus sp. IW2-2015]|uniref:ankyrin repeat and sterile alpha motif domain-containing protein 1B-like n=1 Tax=Salvelinus sp. IW2-2015 TaxID=2691554 RepID=UPI0038D3B113
MFRIASNNNIDEYADSVSEFIRSKRCRIDANITDCQGRTALEILREHPAQKSQQITALMQEYMMEEMMDNKCVLIEEPIRQCPVPTPRTSIPSLSASPSLRHKNDAVTGELSKLLNEMKMCRDRDYSFEELCQTISSHSHSRRALAAVTYQTRSDAVMAP